MDTKEGDPADGGRLAATEDGWQRIEDGAGGGVVRIQLCT
jgi:hypothetical protein